MLYKCIKNNESVPKHTYKDLTTLTDLAISHYHCGVIAKPIYKLLETSLHNFKQNNAEFGRCAKSAQGGPKK